MLFGTPLFLLVFLPLTLAGFCLVGRRFGRAPALGLLIAASFVFYGWEPPGGRAAAGWFDCPELRARKPGAGRAMVCGRRRGQSRRARLVQIRPSDRRQPRSAGSASGFAAGDKFFHLSTGYVSFRMSARRTAAGFPELCRLHCLLRPPVRRAAGAAGGGHAADRARAGAGLPRGGGRRGPHDRAAGSRQKAGARGRLRALRRSRFRCRGPRRTAEPVGGLVCAARLQPADLFRLLRLFRHRHRRCRDVRHPLPVELQQPVQSPGYPGFLAALEHDVEPLPARLPLHPPGRQSPWRGAAPAQPDADHAARRLVAWGCMEVPALGRFARPLSHHPSGVAAPDVGLDAPAAVPGAEPDTARRHPRLGSVPCGEHWRDRGHAARPRGVQWPRHPSAAPGPDALAPPYRACRAGAARARRRPHAEPARCHGLPPRRLVHRPPSAASA